ncbi:hypothetical protein BLNAU_374 [Blattamonas nauphoetae]|uniref:Ciliary microtubule inner protein 2A-C-like domain-containing protein n=1 Tax=Blattamonas nauphoetae TaxID=2049346 RepID=A0ABQ9YL25_9EUKA|nr:hypothetical protein BLNAU_374 [Blattamonas nauphoetae]
MIVVDVTRIVVQDFYVAELLIEQYFENCRNLVHLSEQFNEIIKNANQDGKELQKSRRANKSISIFIPTVYIIAPFSVIHSLSQHRNGEDVDLINGFLHYALTQKLVVNLDYDISIQVNSSSTILPLIFLPKNLPKFVDDFVISTYTRLHRHVCTRSCTALALSSINRLNMTPQTLLFHVTSSLLQRIAFILEFVSDPLGVVFPSLVRLLDIIVFVDSLFSIDPDRPSLFSLDWKGTEEDATSTITINSNSITLPRLLITSSYPHPFIKRVKIPFIAALISSLSLHTTFSTHLIGLIFHSLRLPASKPLHTSSKLYLLSFLPLLLAISHPFVTAQFTDTQSSQEGSLFQPSSPRTVPSSLNPPATTPLSPLSILPDSFFSHSFLRPLPPSNLPLPKPSLTTATNAPIYSNITPFSSTFAFSDASRSLLSTPSHPLTQWTFFKRERRFNADNIDVFKAESRRLKGLPLEERHDSYEMISDHLFEESASQPQKPQSALAVQSHVRSPSPLPETSISPLTPHQSPRMSSSQTLPREMASLPLSPRLTPRDSVSLHSTQPTPSVGISKSAVQQKRESQFKQSLALNTFIGQLDLVEKKKMAWELFQENICDLLQHPPPQLEDDQAQNPKTQKKYSIAQSVFGGYDGIPLFVSTAPPCVSASFREEVIARAVIALVISTKRHLTNVSLASTLISSVLSRSCSTLMNIVTEAYVQKQSSSPSKPPPSTDPSQHARALQFVMEGFSSQHCRSVYLDRLTFSSWKRQVGIFYQLVSLSKHLPFNVSTADVMSALPLHFLTALHFCSSLSESSPLSLSDIREILVIIIYSTIHLLSKASNHVSAASSLFSSLLCSILPSLFLSILNIFPSHTSFVQLLFSLMSTLFSKSVSFCLAFLTHPLISSITPSQKQIPSHVGDSAYPFITSVFNLSSLLFSVNSARSTHPMTLSDINSEHFHSILPSILNSYSLYPSLTATILKSIATAFQQIQQMLETSKIDFVHFHHKISDPQFQSDKNDDMLNEQILKANNSETIRFDETLLSQPRSFLSFILSQHSWPFFVQALLSTPGSQSASPSPRPTYRPVEITQGVFVSFLSNLILNHHISLQQATQSSQSLAQTGMSDLFLNHSHSYFLHQHSSQGKVNAKLRPVFLHQIAELQILQSAGRLQHIPSQSTFMYPPMFLRFTDPKSISSLTSSFSTFLTTSPILSPLTLHTPFVANTFPLTYGRERFDLPDVKDDTGSEHKPDTLSLHTSTPPSAPHSPDSKDVSSPRSEVTPRLSFTTPSSPSIPSPLSKTPSIHRPSFFRMPHSSLTATHSSATLPTPMTPSQRSRDSSHSLKSHVPQAPSPFRYVSQHEQLVLRLNTTLASIQHFSSSVSSQQSVNRRSESVISISQKDQAPHQSTIREIRREDISAPLHHAIMYGAPLLFIITTSPLQQNYILELLRSSVHTLLLNLHSFTETSALLSAISLLSPFIILPYASTNQSHDDPTYKPTIASSISSASHLNSSLIHFSRHIFTLFTSKPALFGLSSALSLYSFSSRVVTSVVSILSPLFTVWHTSVKAHLEDYQRAEYEHLKHYAIHHKHGQTSKKQADPKLNPIPAPPPSRKNTDNVNPVFDSLLNDSAAHTQMSFPIISLFLNEIVLPFIIPICSCLQNHSENIPLLHSIISLLSCISSSLSLTKLFIDSGGLHLLFVTFDGFLHNPSQTYPTSLSLSLVIHSLSLIASIASLIKSLFHNDIRIYTEELRTLSTARNIMHSNRSINLSSFRTSPYDLISTNSHPLFSPLISPFTSHIRIITDSLDKLTPQPVVVLLHHLIQSLSPFDVFRDSFIQNGGIQKLIHLSEINVSKCSSLSVSCLETVVVMFGSQNDSERWRRGQKGEYDVLSAFLTGNGVAVLLTLLQQRRDEYRETHQPTRKPPEPTTSRIVIPPAVPAPPPSQTALLASIESAPPRPPPFPTLSSGFKKGGKPSQQLVPYVSSVPDSILTILFSLFTACCYHNPTDTAHFLNMGGNQVSSILLSTLSPTPSANLLKQTISAFIVMSLNDSLLSILFPSLSSISSLAPVFTMLYHPIHALHNATLDRQLLYKIIFRVVSLVRAVSFLHHTPEVRSLTWLAKDTDTIDLLFKIMHSCSFDADLVAIALSLLASCSFTPSFARDLTTPDHIRTLISIIQKEHRLDHPDFASAFLFLVEGIVSSNTASPSTTSVVSASSLTQMQQAYRFLDSITDSIGKSFQDKNPTISRHAHMCSEKLKLVSSMQKQSINEALGIPAQHKIPGYVGFVPGKSEVIGMRYGEATSQCMNQFEESQALERTKTRAFVRGKTDIPQIPDTPQNIKCTHKIPGYQGFVPRMQNHYWGHSFGRDCEAATEDFESSTICPRALYGGVKIPDSTTRSFKHDKHKTHPYTSKF